MRNVILRDEDSIIASLKELYEKAGFTAFKIRKFEEYSLYLENRNFLTSEQVITVNDPNGRLLALKPDVTLSIVKNTKATPEKSEKFYYRERVYRYDKHAREYREISQTGLETLGNITAAEELETALLAIHSLDAISADSVLLISDMGFISAVFEAAGITTDEGQKEVLSYLTARNKSGMSEAAAANGATETGTGLLLRLADTSGNIEKALPLAESLAVSGKAVSAFSGLKTLCQSLAELGYGDRIRLDFSASNDMEYYTGVVFRGYAEGLSSSVLSGGRYDKLAKKFGGNIGAIGFAVYLGELMYHQPPREFDADVFLLYDESDKPSEVIKYAEKLRSEGKRVRIGTSVSDNLNIPEKGIIGL